jgi:hypothetical protein
MSLQDFPEETRINERIFRFVSYTLVALMLAAASMTLAQLITRLFFDWNPWYLGLICFGVALDRQYTYRTFKKLLLFSSEWVISFGSHLVIIALLVKVIVGVSHGLASFLVEIPLWRRGFVDYFLNIEFVSVLAIAMLTWFISGYFAELLDEMGLDQALIMRDVMAPVHGNQRPARDRLRAFVFGLGSGLVVITALIRVDVRAIFEGSTQLNIFDMPSLAGGGWSTLLYFMLGLALLSQTQFISLNTRWSLQRVPVHRKLAGQWALYSVLFLLIVAVMVSVLPTSYSLGFLSVLNYVIDFVVQIFVFIFQLIFAGLMFLVSLPFLLMGREPPVEAGTPEVPELPEPPLDLPAGMANAPIPWMELLKSLLFWSVFLAILIFSLVHYLRLHREILERLRKIPGWKLLEQFWRWLRGFFGGVNQRVAGLVRAGRDRIRLRRRDSGFDGIGNFLSLRNLTPRQRVYFFYYALIRRGGESGLARRGSQTPLEYASTLEDALPTVDEDVESITDAFLEARYSRHALRRRRE